MDLTRVFVHNIKKWRKIRGFSQKELAEKCDAAHSYIRQLESGKGHPSFAFIGKIADALQTEPYLLFYDETAQAGHTIQARQLESLQQKLLETVSNDIRAAFEDFIMVQKPFQREPLPD